MATIYHLGKTKGDDFAAFFERETQPELAETGISVLGSFITETHPNTFPGACLCERTRSYSCGFRIFQIVKLPGRQQQLLNRCGEKKSRGNFAELIKEQPEVLLLSPTPRSLL